MGREWAYDTLGLIGTSIAPAPAFFALSVFFVKKQRTPEICSNLMVDHHFYTFLSLSIKKTMFSIPHVWSSSLIFGQPPRSCRCPGAGTIAVVGSARLPGALLDLTAVHRPASFREPAVH